jgi:hypothetical protein
MAATPRPMYRGDSDNAKPGGAVGAVRPGVRASRQVSSVTPKFSSMISDRSHPGVTHTAVAPRGPSSCPSENASLFTATFARS